jgi:hypothetical protein
MRMTLSYVLVTLIAAFVFEVLRYILFLLVPLPPVPWYVLLGVDIFLPVAVPLSRRLCLATGAYGQGITTSHGLSKSIKGEPKQSVKESRGVIGHENPLTKWFASAQFVLKLAQLLW